MIGFDYPDGHGNAETLVPVNLTVLPEINITSNSFKNDDGQNIADKPASKQAGHPVFYVYAGNQGNASVNLGGSVTSIQPLRINLTSNENFTDKDWQITGIPRTLHMRIQQIELIMPENVTLNWLVIYYRVITLEQYDLDVKNNYSRFVLNHIHQQLLQLLSN